MFLSSVGELDKDNKKKLLNTISEMDPAHNEFYRGCGDMDNGRLFADVFKDMCRYNVSAKEWYTYDGKRWIKDLEGKTAEGLAMVLTKALIIYSAEVGDKYYTQAVSKLQARSKRMNMLRDAESFYKVRTEDFDQDPYLFNCQNGVIDLRTRELLDHDPAHMLSKISNVYYDRSCKCDLFEQVLDQLMCGDQSLVKYLQQVFGYSLTGENTQEECYMFYGATTRNGKSTLLDTMEYLFGDYAMNIQPETLAKQDRNSRNASGDIARLKDVRLVHMSEPPKRMNIDVALLKQLLGRDQVTARRMYEEEFQFIPVFKLMINTNFLPLVTDDTLFASGRIKVIPFMRHFKPEEQDKHLKSKLKTRESISGIFNWILEGLGVYCENNEVLDVPDAVTNATEEYREKSDKIKCYISECLAPAPGYTVTGGRVYDNYSKWCEQNGYKVENKRNFFDELRAKGMLHDRGTINGVSERNIIKEYTFKYIAEMQ